MDALTTTALAISGALLILYLVKGPRSAAAPFPGPRPLPFLGNPDQVLVKEPWVQLGKLRQRYGRLFCMLTRVLCPSLIRRSYHIPPVAGCATVGVEQCRHSSRAPGGQVFPLLKPTPPKDGGTVGIRSYYTSTMT